MSYHNGSVWPHDNALIVAGMTAYGHREAAMEIISAQLEAGRYLPDHRLPELFCGFARDRRYASRPTEYLVSCSPQAWSAAAPFLLLQSALGLRPGDAFGAAPVIDPVLPEGIDRIAVHRLRAAGGTWSSLVRRTAAACASAAASRRERWSRHRHDPAPDGPLRPLHVPGHGRWRGDGHRAPRRGHGAAG